MYGIYICKWINRLILDFFSTEKKITNLKAGSVYTVQLQFHDMNGRHFLSNPVQIRTFRKLFLGVYNFAVFLFWFTCIYIL